MITNVYRSLWEEQVKSSFHSVFCDLLCLISCSNSQVATVPYRRRCWGKASMILRGGTRIWHKTPLTPEVFRAYFSRKMTLNWKNQAFEALGDSRPGRRNSMCKGPEVEVSSECLGAREKQPCGSSREACRESNRGQAMLRSLDFILNHERSLF